MSLASALKGLRPPPQQLVEDLIALRCRIEGKLHNPTKARIGAKYPMRTMLGPMMAKYYPATMKMGCLQGAAKNEDPEVRGFIRDQAEIYAQMTHQYRLLKGKTARPLPRITNKKRKR